MPYISKAFPNPNKPGDKAYAYKPKAKSIVIGQMPEAPWKIKRPWYIRLLRWVRRLGK